MFLFLPSTVLLWFIDFGGFRVVPVVSRWARTCVEVFHQRKSSDSTRAHRSGLILFGEKTCSCTDFLRFTEFWFVLGHDPLEVAYLLPGESLCKVSGQSKLVCLSFGLGIDFSPSLLVHTKHVWWAYRTCPVVKIFSLELKFGGALPQGVQRLCLKLHDFLTSFGRLFYFSAKVALCCPVQLRLVR